MEFTNANSGSAQLSTLLRESTMMAHRHAEGAGFIKDLFSGRCTPENYVKYLWGFKQIYKALEKSLSNCASNKSVYLINFTQLYRTETLNSDLNVWNKSTPLSVPENVKRAVATYVSRIETVAEHKPELLVAHSYVRYLGDLSGGQILLKTLSQHAPKENGYQFYQFDNIDTSQMKILYRQRLDEIGNLNSQMAPDICAEADLVFNLNAAVFKALESN